MRISAALLLLPLAACAVTDTVPPEPAAAPLAPAAQRAVDYPETARIDVVETLFGERLVDPYRWLENDVREDPRVRQWVTAQNAVTDAYLATLPERAAVQRRMTEL